jgi:hypothetical protein
MNFQSNLRLKELGKTMAMQQPQQTVKPEMNHVLNFDPYKYAQMNLNREKLNADIADDQAKNEIARQSLGLKEDIANNPNVVQVKTAGGEVYLMDKKSGRILNTGVAQGTQTDAEKAQNAVNLENTRETNRENLEGVRQSNRAINLTTRGKQAMEQIGARGEEARKTKETDTPYNPNMLATQNLVRQKLAAQQIINSNPDLAPFITIDPNTGLVSVKQPGTGGFFGSSGPTQDQYQKILGMLYPQGRTSMSDNNGKVRVKLPDGRIGYMSPEKAKQPGIVILGGSEQ